MTNVIKLLVMSFGAFAWLNLIACGFPGSAEEAENFDRTPVTYNFFDVPDPYAQSSQSSYRYGQDVQYGYYPNPSASSERLKHYGLDFNLGLPGYESHHFNHLSQTSQYNEPHTRDYLQLLQHQSQHAESLQERTETSWQWQPSHTNQPSNLYTSPSQNPQRTVKFEVSKDMKKDVNYLMMAHLTFPALKPSKTRSSPSSVQKPIFFSDDEISTIVNNAFSSIPTMHPSTAVERCIPSERAEKFIKNLCHKNIAFLLCIHPCVTDGLIESEVKHTLEFLQVCKSSTGGSRYHFPGLMSHEIWELNITNEQNAHDKKISEAKIILEILGNYYKIANKKKFHKIVRNDDGFLLFYLLFGRIAHHGSALTKFTSHTNMYRVTEALPWIATNEVEIKINPQYPRSHLFVEANPDQQLGFYQKRKTNRKNYRPPNNS